MNNFERYTPDPQRRLPHDPKVVISTCVSSKLWKMAKDNNLSWAKVLDFGLRVRLADLDLMDYPDCKLLQDRDRARKNFMELSNGNEQNGEKTENKEGYE